MQRAMLQAEAAERSLNILLIRLDFILVKGKYHANLLSFQNPNEKCLSVSRNNEIIVNFVINYHPSAINCQLVPLARDRVGRCGLKLEKC